MSQLTIATMLIVISTVAINIFNIPKVYSQTKSNAANLMTEAATINNKWNLVNNNFNTKNSSFAVTDPECKKINPLDYLNNPETFFQPCLSDTDLNPKNYEPIEYLKVPGLDSSLSVTVTNF